MGQRHTSPADRGGVQNAGGYLMLEKFSAEDTYTISDEKANSCAWKKRFKIAPSRYSSARSQGLPRPSKSFQTSAKLQIFLATATK
jgi:hypothetical protein